MEFVARLELERALLLSLTRFELSAHPAVPPIPMTLALASRFAGLQDARPRFGIPESKTFAVSWTRAMATRSNCEDRSPCGLSRCAGEHRILPPLQSDWSIEPLLGRTHENSR